MRFNEDKKSRLADLLAKQRAAAARKSLSAPLAPFASIVPATQPMNPALAATEFRGVLAVESNDEDTYTGLVHKRPRVGASMVPSPSASAGAPTFVDHPPSTSSPFPAVLGGGEGSATRNQILGTPSTTV